MTRPHTHSAGFTIIELMVTIAVVAVLLSIAVPAFGDLMRRNRIAAQTNTVIGALNYARAETATRGMPVSVCAARNADRTSCVDAAETATTWTNGWIVFTDRTGIAGQLDGMDQALQSGAMPMSDFTFTSSATYVRFGVGANGATERTLAITPINTSVCLSTGKRNITVARTGRVNSTKSSC
ncbi:MAG: GspH/FimT family pseudopilin [Steroidobacter sp.]